MLQGELNNPARPIDKIAGVAGLMLLAVLCPHNSLLRAVGHHSPNSVSVYSSCHPRTHSDIFSQCYSQEGHRLHPDFDHLSNPGCLSCLRESPTYHGARTRLWYETNDCRQPSCFYYRFLREDSEYVCHMYRQDLLVSPYIPRCTTSTSIMYLVWEL